MSSTLLTPPLTPLPEINTPAPLRPQDAPSPLSLRLLHVATSPGEGGIERYSVRLASGLAQHGAYLRFACLPGGRVGRLCAAAGIPTLPLAVRNSGDLRAAWRLARMIGREHIDLVHVHSRRDYLPALLGVVLARRLAPSPTRRPRLLLHAHMVRPLGAPGRMSSRLFERHADGVLAVSEAVQTHLLAGYNFAPGFVRLLHNGVDLERFPPFASHRAQAWRRALRQEWAIPQGALVIAMVGRLDTKGQDAMLAAAPPLLAEAPGLHIVFAGAEGQPGTQARLRALARAGGLEERVKFLGAREDVPAVLAAADVLVHLPQDESFGLALAEAMASGLPTVATDIGGCREVTLEGQTGRLIPPGDQEALLRALLPLLGAGSGPLRHRLGAAGRARVDEKFSLAGQGARLEEYYHELCPLPR